MPRGIYSRKGTRKGSTVRKLDSTRTSGALALSPAPAVVVRQTPVLMPADIAELLKGCDAATLRKVIIAGLRQGAAKL